MCLPFASDTWFSVCPSCLCASGLSHLSPSAYERAAVCPAMCFSSECQCPCLSVGPLCLYAELIYLCHTPPAFMLLACWCLCVFGSISVLLLRLPCHCVCLTAVLSRCMSGPVSVSLVGSLLVARVTGVVCVWTGSLGVTVYLYTPCHPPQVWPLWAMFTLPPADFCLPCPGRG